jgi:hypothetical protein
MSDPKDLVLVNEQLRQSIRRWKALALAACSVLALVVLVGFVGVTMEQTRAAAQMRAANEAFARAKMAANPGQPR